MFQKVKSFIDEKRLPGEGAVLIAGISGGADSMALLDILTLLGCRCIVAHCNFHLRGEESDEDARFVKGWCKKNDLEFTSIDFDTRQYAADRGISIEMAARELRYSWFEMVRKQYDAEAIAVAHHKDDSAETLLMNLVRGTGISGLCGILPQNGKVVRPLLCVTRSEIETYLNERGIPFRTDSTNREDIYARNHIRLNVIPQLKKLNPSVVEAILRTAGNLSEETLMAGSTAKQAELVAKQIFDLRRSRNDILIGEADNMPPDGEAYKVVMEQINAQEKALTEMFSGSTQTEYFTREIVIVPTEKEIDRMIIGRFSVKLGPVDADNLAGEPIYLTLRNKTPKIESAISDKERERLEKKLSEGVVYNVPGKAQLILEFKNRALKDMEVDVVQFGTKDVLVKKMFDNMKQPIKVIFYPELGAIRQIIQ
jgi:tRNA(Ile)-lysidine synthetase-like protein